MLAVNLARSPESNASDRTDDDAAVVSGVLAGSAAARAALFDRHAALVQRVLARMLGADTELEDLLHDVFVEAFASLGGLRDPNAVRSWLVGVAAHTARRCIRRRRRGRWLMFFASEDLPEPEVSSFGEEAYGELRMIHWLLRRMGVEEQLVFSLRWLEGMEIEEVARACDLSRSTTKRRLAAAERRFRAMARHEPSIERWLGGT